MEFKLTDNAKAIKSAKDARIVVFMGVLSEKDTETLNPDMTTKVSNQDRLGLCNLTRRLRA